MQAGGKGTNAMYINNNVKNNLEGKQTEGGGGREGRRPGVARRVKPGDVNRPQVLGPGIARGKLSFKHKLCVFFGIKYKT